MGSSRRRDTFANTRDGRAPQRFRARELPAIRQGFGTLAITNLDTRLRQFILRSTTKDGGFRPRATLRRDEPARQANEQNVSEFKQKENEDNKEDR